MVRGKLFERRRSAASGGQQIVPGGEVRKPAKLCLGRIEVGDHDHALDRANIVADLLDAREQINAASVIEVAVDGDQHFGFYLAEAVQNSQSAEVSRTGRPDGAQAGASEQADDRLGNVGQIARHSIARPYAQPL